MLLALKMFCEETRIRKDGTAVIYIRYIENRNQRTLLNTGILIPPSSWNDEKQEIVSDLDLMHVGAKELNEQLYHQARIAEDIVRIAKKHNILDIGPF